MDIDPYSEFALRSITIRTDSSLRNVVAHYFPLQLQIAAAPEDLQPRLSLVQGSYRFREVRTQGRIHHRRVVREISNRDRMRRLVVDVCAVELITDGTAAQKEQHGAY